MTAVATIAFIILAILSFTSIKHRETFQSRTRSSWALDSIGLIFQGFLAAILIGLVTGFILRAIAPKYAGFVEINPFISFLLFLFLVDYLFYWSHRLFHHPKLFSIHFIHHSSEKLDLLATSRNTLWQPFLYPHIWFISLAIYLLADPIPLILALEIHGAFDYWNHANFIPKEPLLSKLRLIFITPHQHSWHHSTKKYRSNFGNMFSFWDRLHGTYFHDENLPQQMGLAYRKPWWKMLIFPIGRSK